MTEYLEFTVYVPIDTPNINHTTDVYYQVVREKRQAAEKILQALPSDWEYAFERKIPE